ncbi:hypothetical protein CH063_10738 [Colletotrichum higginsianum]|uniref:Uncharacterized protein n=1 Tax=Colletotrichum higginsianum (strain IMI 349063) TaxID=759273 RepID=H1VIL6_COLHI|nr:hypothetical protein CH063_10738 [Colletotrichum higginsianum]
MRLFAAAAAVVVAGGVIGGVQVPPAIVAALVVLGQLPPVQHRRPRQALAQALAVHLASEGVQGDVLQEDDVLPSQPRGRARVTAAGVPVPVPTTVPTVRGKPEGDAEAGAGVVADEDLDEGQLVAPAGPDGARLRDGDDAGDEVDGDGLGREAEEVWGRGHVSQVGQAVGRDERRPGAGGGNDGGGGVVVQEGVGRLADEGVAGRRVEGVRVLALCRGPAGTRGGRRGRELGGGEVMVQGEGVVVELR